MNSSINTTKIFALLITSILVIALFSAFQIQAQLPIPSDAKRGDVLVIENHWGTFPDPYDFNPVVPGKPGFGGSGYNQVCAGWLWYINTTNSELIHWLAAGPPEYSPDFTQMTVYLRRGITWSDGHPFTADDVIFTVELLINNPGLVGHATLKQWVEKVEKIDDYTVKFYLKGSNPRFHYFFTVVIYQATVRILPKHVWEGKDPLTFKFYPPVCLGPYVLKSVDPGGNWFLWERNENWWGTKLYGMKPAPKYVLFIHHGPEDVKALAMIRHELDAIRTFLPENFEVVWKNNPYIGGWRAKPPFAWPFDACVKGITFNLLRYPYNITEVRRALVHAIDFRVVYEAFKGPDGSLPEPAALPIVPTPVAVELYYKPLEPELIKLGYDPSIRWWKYDPQKAEELLKSVGFYRGPDGKWRLPNGEIWKIEILAPSDIEMESLRIGQLVADQWRAFGIEAYVRPVQGGVFLSAESRGEYDVGTFWPGCSLLTDLTPHFQTQGGGWHSKYYDPAAPYSGWVIYNFPKRAELNSILDEMERTPPWDPKIYELGRKALLIWAEQLPWAGFFPTPFYTLNDNYVWTGWPHYPENYYMDPVYWWAQLLFIILQLKPTGNVERVDKTMPGKPPILPIEIPTPTPTTGMTITRTVTVTQTSVETTTVTVPDTTTTIVVGIVLLIIGFVLGWLLKKRG